MDSLKLKKIIKLIGNCLVILALAFLVYKITSMDIDFSVMYSSSVLCSFIIAVALQTVFNLIACYPWSVFVESFSGIKIPFIDSMHVFVQANIYKYLPGNVMQYVGRNKLAYDFKLSHITVAISTLLDIGMCILSFAIVAVCLLGNNILDLYDKYLGRSFFNTYFWGFFCFFRSFFVAYFL